MPTPTSTPTSPQSHWFPDVSASSLAKWYTNKDQTMRKYVELMLARTSQMFVYHNLPASMSPQLLETWLQTYGQLCIARIPESELLHLNVLTTNTNELVPNDPIPGPGIDMLKIIEQADQPTEDLTGSAASNTSTSDLYFFTCEAGGRYDIYYRPTMCVVANPLFKESHRFTIGKDCVLMKNDVFSQGLLPVMFRYAKEYVEADITIISSFINSRIRTIIEASEGPEIESARAYLADIEAGKMSAIASRPLIEGLKVWSENTGTSASILTQTIEARQALQVAWYNELGIDPNFSLKREYVSAEEIGSNTDLLMPLVDHLLVCRKDAVDQINALFGTDISVEKASAWAHKSRMAQSNAVQHLEEIGEKGGNSGDDDVSESDAEKSDSAE